MKKLVSKEMIKGKWQAYFRASWAVYVANCLERFLKNYTVLELPKVFLQQTFNRETLEFPETFLQHLQKVIQDLVAKQGASHSTTKVSRKVTSSVGRRS